MKTSMEIDQLSVQRFVDVMTPSKPKVDGKPADLFSGFSIRAGFPFVNTFFGFVNDLSLYALG